MDTLINHGAITTALPVVPVVAEEGVYDPNVPVSNIIPVNYDAVTRLEGNNMNVQPPVEAMNVQPVQKGCWGKFCQTNNRITGRNEVGGRKTKRLRKKYKKTRNIKKRQIKKRALSKKTN